MPQIRRMLSDGDAGVRAAAIGALSSISQEDAASFARPLLADRRSAHPRNSGGRHGRQLASRGRRPSGGDAAPARQHHGRCSKAARRDVAIAIRQMADPRFRRLLIPLLYDPAPEVADEAMESVASRRAKTTSSSCRRSSRCSGTAGSRAEPGRPLSLTATRWSTRWRSSCAIPRRTSGCAATFPGTLAHIPSQKTVDVLVAALEERDGFIRYKVVSALERLRREHPEFTLKSELIEALAIQEARRYFNFLSLHDNLFGKEKLAADSLLAQGLTEQMTRLRNRILKLLTLLYQPADIDAARWTLEHGDARGRSSASEYLDNLLSAPLRKQVLPVLEDMPREERVRRGNVILKTRPRDVEETLLQLINDDDPVTAAAAIDVVRDAEDVEPRR